MFHKALLQTTNMPTSLVSNNEVQYYYTSPPREHEALTRCWPVVGPEA